MIDPQMQQIVYHFPSYRIAFPASGTNRQSVVPHFFEDGCPRMAFLQSLRMRVATNDSVPLTGFTRRRLFTTSNAASAEKDEAKSAERLGPEAAPTAPPSRFEWLSPFAHVTADRPVPGTSKYMQPLHPISASAEVNGCRTRHALLAEWLTSCWMGVAWHL